MASWALFGGGGHARSVHDALERAGHRVALVVARETVALGGAEIVTDDRVGLERLRREPMPTLVVIGDNGIRLRLVEWLLAQDVTVPPFVATTATVAPTASLGAGAVVLEHAHVGPESTVGVAAVVNTAAIVEHDCALGDGSHVASGSTLAGHVRCGRRALVGAGAVARPFATIGEDAVVGAGAVVVRAVADGATAFGVPAAPRT